MFPYIFVRLFVLNQAKMRRQRVVCVPKEKRVVRGNRHRHTYFS